MLSRMMSRSTVTTGVSRSATVVMRFLSLRLLGALVDRHVSTARSAEGLAAPAFPPLAQAQPGHARHQVQLGRPRVADLDRVQLDAARGDDDVVRAHALGNGVMDTGLEIDRLGAEVGHADALAVREAGQIRD